MKTILLILLFALACSKFPEDIIEIAKCLIKSEALRGLIPKVIEAIKNKDYMSIVFAIIQAFPQIKEEVMNCLNPEPVLKLDTSCYSRCTGGCPGVHENYGKRKECMWNCFLQCQ